MVRRPYVSKHPQSSSPAVSMKKNITQLAALALTVCVGVARAATITVTSDASAGPGTLYASLSSLASGDTIVFSIPGNGVHHIVTPVGGYPILSNLANITINGYSQAGASPNSHTIL